MAQRTRSYKIGGVGSVRGLTAMIVTEYFLVRCNAHKRAQAVRKIPLHGVSTADSSRQEGENSREINKSC
jgi:hypothetical protein